MKTTSILLILLLAIVANAQDGNDDIASGTPDIPAEPAVDYPILAIKHIRVDDNHRTTWPEVFNPITHEVSDLVIIHPDGAEEILVSGNGTDAILDPKTLDGKNVYFVRIRNTKTKNSQLSHIAGGIPRAGSDIFSINIDTKVETQWTDQIEIPFKGISSKTKS